MKWKHKFEQIPTPPKTSNLKAPTRHCSTPSDFVWASLKFKKNPQRPPTGLRPVLPDIVQNSNPSLMASFLGEPYKYSSTSNGSPSLPLCSTIAKANFLHLQRPKTLSPRVFTPSSWSRDWVKQGFEFLVWFIFSSSSWLLNLHPPRLLLLEPCS
jgi:hypothetical protein